MSGQVFEIFPWNRNFETGIAVVDEQHRKLVEIINHLATHLGNRAEDVALEKVFADLAAYADYHFKTEEGLWQESFRDDPEYLSHKHTHDSFLDKVTEIRNRDAGKPLHAIVEDILRFLTHWLAYHILDNDKRMAKTHLAVQAGLSLAEAKARAHAEMSGSMQVMIETVLSMYDHLSTRTLELMRERHEHTRIEQALKDSEQREKAFSDTLMRSVPGLLYLFDEELKLVRWNERFSDITGYSPEELSKMHLLDFFEPRFHEAIRQDIASFYHGDYGETEGRLLCKDGRGIPFLFTSVPLAIEGHDYFIGIGTDISKRKRAEKRLHMLSSSIEQAGEAILITDRAGDIKYVNPAFTRLTGYSEEEVLDRNPRLLGSGIQDAAFYKQMWDSINAGKGWQGRVMDRKKDGSFYPVMLTISPIRNAAGGIENFVGIQQDLSAYENLEQQFHQAQKMEAIGTLVGGIAHDFNNMLAGIMGNLYLVQSRVKDMPDVSMKLKGIEQLSFRAADMIHQLLTFARKDQVSMKPLPLNAFVKEAVKFMHSSIPENIELQMDAQDDTLNVNGDATQLHQVLLNLVNNARDALEDAARPRIEIRLSRLRADDTISGHLGLPAPGEYAHLSVSDNGEGIAAGQMPHLFEPFYTTKAQGKGTGLGLAMVFGAMQNHHGHVRAESNPGEGTSFHLYIPVLNRASDARDHTGNDAVAMGAGETILLVDDDEHVISVGADLLKSLGYEVLTARDGHEAVAVYDANIERIALVMMDVVMPVLGGIEAAERIRQLRPDVKVIFCSGYDNNGSLPEHLPDGCAMFAKPYSVPELSRAIRRLLTE